MRLANSYELRVTVLFVGLLFVYLLIAQFFHAPRGYYGSIDEPRFADPWIARSETILRGDLLYRDVFTSTPPVTNALMVIPSLIPIFIGNFNPWATLSFMIFFALFCLFTAYLLLNMGPNKKEGFFAATIFLLNPLTLGNAVLRRQDESIVVFFIALSLFFILRNRHTIASITIGGSLLVKLSGGLLIPVALIHKRNWRYLILPPLVFLLVMAPFILLAGSDAIFWDFTTTDAGHPFQFDGVSPFALWNRMQGDSSQIPLLPIAAIMILGLGATLALVAWKRYGIIEDTIILATAIFLLSPKLHTGYFSILAMLMALLIKDIRLVILYLVFGALAVTADFYKFPLTDYKIAFWLMVGVLILMLILTLGINLQSRGKKKNSALPRSTA